MVTGVRHNEQPGDLEAGEGAHVTGGDFGGGTALELSNSIPKADIVIDCTELHKNKSNAALFTSWNTVI
jgi:hypothetical protein